MEERLIDIKQVADRLQLSKSHIWALVAKGKFPKPVKLSPQISRWFESDLADYQAELKTQRVSH